jgi:hypothetical protein
VDDELVIREGAGVIFRRDPEAALVHMEQFTEVVGVGFRVVLVGKFEIMDVGDTGDPQGSGKRL